MTGWLRRDSVPKLNAFRYAMHCTSMKSISSYQLEVSSAFVIRYSIENKRKERKEVEEERRSCTKIREENREDQRRQERQFHEYEQAGEMFVTPLSLGTPLFYTPDVAV